MGKGDLKSKRGKIINGTYGVRRARKFAKDIVSANDTNAKATAAEKK